MWFGFLDMFCEEHIFFYAQFWILDLFSKIQKFGRSGRRPSSVGLAVVRRSLSAFHVDVVNTFHVDVRIFLCFARRTIFIWCASSWFEPRAMQHDLFSGPGFDSRALLHVYRPVRSVAYVRSWVSWDGTRLGGWWNSLTSGCHVTRFQKSWETCLRQGIGIEKHDKKT